MIAPSRAGLGPAHRPIGARAARNSPTAFASRSSADTLLFVLTTLTLAACSHSGRDVVPESRDVRVQQSDAGAADAYVHVARRPHGAVALAEARNMSDAEARAIVERLADDLEGCAQRLEADKSLVEGAARIVAVAGPDGTPALNVRLAPGGAVAQNALMCLVAPVRALAFPASKTGAPGLAIEATWGPKTR